MQDHSTRDPFTAEIVTIYCLCDDFLRAWGHTDDPQARMTTAEVMTVVLAAAALFGGNQERCRRFLKEHGYIRRMLSRSRLNRRWHEIPEAHWQALFALIAGVHCQMNQGGECAADSMPVPACDNIRIRRCRLYPLRRTGGAFRGYCASKRRYFYGLRVHLVVTASGAPVEFTLAPGSAADISAFREMPLSLPAGSLIWADAAYLDRPHADLLAEAAGIRLVAATRGNSRDPLPAWLAYLCQRARKRIETTFSGLRDALAAKVHATTPRGFELKAAMTVLAYSLTALIP